MWHLLFLILADRIRPLCSSPNRPCTWTHTHTETQAHRCSFQFRLFGTAKGRRVNETNALTMPTLITGPDRPPNRWASARANYAALPADDRANRTVLAASRREACVARFLRARVADSPRLRRRWNSPDRPCCILPFSSRAKKERNFASMVQQIEEGFTQRVRDFSRSERASLCKNWSHRGEFFFFFFFCGNLFSND